MLVAMKELSMEKTKLGEFEMNRLQYEAMIKVEA